MHLARLCLIVLFSLLLTACGETQKHQAVNQVENSTVATAGRDATIIKGDQVIEQQTVFQTNKALIDALILTQQQQNQSLSLFEKATLGMGAIFIFLIISALILWFLFSRLCVESARTALIADLRTGLAQQRLYKRAVTSLLAGVEKIYGKMNQPLRAFNASLLLAYLYPILLFIFAYSFAGGTHSFSGSNVFPESREYAIAYFPGLILLGGIVYLMFYKFAAANDWGKAQLKRLLSTTPSVSGQIWSILMGVCAACISYFMIQKGSVGWGLFWLFLGYYTGAAAVAIAAAIAAAIAVVVIVIVAVLAGVAGVAGVAGIFGVAVAGVFGVVFVGFSGVNEKYNIATLFLFFYFTLPLLNAFLDWISWWISRYFLAKTLQTNNPFYIALEMLTDITFAIVCLMLLCILLPAGSIALDTLASYFNWVDKSTQTLAQTNWQYHAYAAFADPRGEGLMVTAMLFSTLIPTLLHLVLACSAVIIHLLHGYKLADYLESAPKGDHFRYAGASLWLYGYGVLAFILVIAITIGVVQLLKLPVGTWLYDFTYSIYAGYDMQAR